MLGYGIIGIGLSFLAAAGAVLLGVARTTTSKLPSYRLSVNDEDLSARQRSQRPAIKLPGEGVSWIHVVLALTGILFSVSLGMSLFALLVG